MKAAICHMFLVLLAIIQHKVIQKRFHKVKEFCDWYCPFTKRKMGIFSPAYNQQDLDTELGITYPGFPLLPWPETSGTEALVRVWGHPEWQQCPQPPPSCQGHSLSGWYPAQTGLPGPRHSTGLSPSTSSEVRNDSTDFFVFIYIYITKPFKNA